VRYIYVCCPCMSHGTSNLDGPLTGARVHTSNQVKCVANILPNRSESGEKEREGA